MIANKTPHNYHPAVVLFVNLVLIILLYPFLTQDIGRCFLKMLFSIVLFSALWTISHTGNNIRLGLWIGLPWFVLSISRSLLEFIQVMDIPFLWPIVELFFSLAFLLYVMVMIFRYILNSSEINENVLFAAVSLYMLLGIFWGCIYAMLETFQPDSFQFNTPMPMNEGRAEYYHFLFFSYVTMTTLGYGDITPLTLQAQSLVILQTLSSFFYSAIFISRMVGLYRPRTSNTP